MLQVCPNLAILVPALVEGGIDELEKRCTLTPGLPLSLEGHFAVCLGFWQQTMTSLFYPC